LPFRFQRHQVSELSTAEYRLRPGLGLHFRSQGRADLHQKAGPMMVAVLSVTFGEHVPEDRIRSMTSGLAVYGNVHPGSEMRSFTVEVFRLSKLPRL